MTHPSNLNETDINTLKSKAAESREQGAILDYLELMEEIHTREPGNMDHLVELIETLSDLNQWQQAEEYLDKALAMASDDQRLKRLQDFLHAREDKAPLKYEEKDLNRFLMLFRGREGVFARQALDNKGRWGYFPVHSPLDGSVVRSHLDGDLTAGLYFTRIDNTVLAGCIDFDINKRVLDSFEQEKIDRVRSDLNEYVIKAAEICSGLSLPFLLENSGNKGYHIWLFFDGGVSAKVARILLKSLLDKFGESPDGIHCEIFPKQDKVEPGGLGNLVKLPLGIHRKTNRRALFVHPQTLEILEDQFETLYQVNPVSESVIGEIIGKLQGTPEKKELNLDSFSKDIKDLVSNCHVINRLVNKAVTEKHLTHSERVVLLYTVSFIPKEGPLFLHNVVSNCSDYDYEITEKFIKKRHDNSMSCPKVRQWLPEISRAVSCSCFFDDVPGKYPNPLRHINYQREISSGEIERTFRDYYEIGQKIKFLLQKRKEAEMKLNSFFDSHQADSVKTPSGTITRSVENGKTRFSLTISD